MFQKQQVVTHPARRILILLLALLLLCGTPTWASADSTSSTRNGTVQTGDTVQVEGTNATAKQELQEMEETGGAVLFSTEATPMAAKDNVELTYTRTIQYEGYFTRNFRVKVDGKTKVAYCVQPKETPPDQGDHVAEDYNNKLMTKALYYSYGYAGYDKHTKQYVSKKDDDDDWSDDDGAYALCHMILSYLYDKSSADSDAFNGVSSDTIKLVKQVADKIENDWPDAPTDSTLTLNHDSVDATWQETEQEQKTPTFRLTAHEDNRIHIKLPKGVKIYRTRNGNTQTFGNQRTIKIYGGDSFYFTADKSVRGTWKSGNLEGSLTSFNPYIIRVTGHQNIVFCGTGETNKVSFSVNWVEWGYLKVTKSLEDGQKRIDLGINLYDGITFSLTGNGENRTLTPNKNGELTDSSGEYPLELLPGTYTLTETSVPDRYREKLVQQFTVTGGQITTGDLKNITKKGNFSLLKVYKEDLQDDESLVFDREEGVVFRVWDYSYYDNRWDYEDVPDLFKDEITTNAQGEAKTKDLPIGHYVVQQVTKDKNHWAVDDFEIDITDKETTTQPVTIIGNKTADVKMKIVKVDADTGNPVEVAGVQFQIKDANGNIVVQLDKRNQPVDTFITEADGIAYLEEPLIAGDYEIVEVKAPEGYVLANEPLKFSVTSDTLKDEMLEVKFPNKAQKVELVLHKQAEEFVTGDKRYSYEKVAMPFVKFDLVAAADIVTPDGSTRLKAGETAQEGLLTNEQGTVKSDPQYPGDYNVVEKGLYSKLRTYTLKEGNVTNILTNWQLALQNAGESLPEQDVQDAFQAALEGTLTSEYQIDKDGNTSWSAPESETDFAFDETQAEVLEAYLKDLPVDQVEESWKELPLDRYRVPEDGIVATVTLKAGDPSQEVIQQELTIVNELKKGELELTKTDISNGEPLPDTGMRIYLEDKETVIFEGRTDQDGKIILKDLVEGNYYYQEFDAPEGYLIDDGLYPFEIKDGEITKCEMTNKLQMGIIELQKGGETYKIKKKKEYVYEKTNTLANATFEVVAAEDIKSPTGKVYALKGVTVATITTDETGKAVTPEIHLGSYILKETKAPEGYVNCKDIPVTLTADGTTEVVKVNVKAENRLAKGTVEITKTDISDGEPLPDTGIQIYDKDKNVILKGRTDKDGKLTFKKLPTGIYYFQEFDAPEGYKIKEDLYQFEIKNDGDIVKCKMTNKAKDGTVEITTTDKNGNVVQTGDEFPLLALLCLMAGVGILFFVVYRMRKREGADEA